MADRSHLDPERLAEQEREAQERCAPHTGNVHVVGPEDRADDEEWEAARERERERDAEDADAEDRERRERGW